MFSLDSAAAKLGPGLDAAELARMPLDEVASAQLERIAQLGKIPDRFILLRNGEVVLDRERDAPGEGLKFLVDDVLHEVGDRTFDEFLHIASGRLRKTPHDGGPTVESLTVMARRHRVAFPVEIVFLEYSDPKLGPPQVVSVERYGAEAQSPVLDPLQNRLKGAQP